MHRRFFLRLEKLRCALTPLLPGFARNTKPGKFPGLPPVCVALIAICLLAFPLPARAAQQVLKGHVPSATKKLVSIGRLDAGTRLNLAIGLPLRNRDKLTNLLEALYQPANPGFRHFLTADQFTASFGPSQEDYQAVIDFAKSRGLMVKGSHSNRTLLDVSGSVADIENAFHVRLQVYQHPVEARTFFAPDVEPSLDLDTPVLAISGLDNYVTPRPVAHTLIRPLTGSGTGGAYLGSDFRNAYAAGVSLTGTGQSVGLFELTGYDPADISSYEKKAKLSAVNLQNILIDGFDGNDTNIDYAVEATADIEMAIAMAPGLASVLIYEGPTPLFEAPLETNTIQYASTTAQINDVLNRMATDNLAAQLSSSYQMDINLSTVQIFEQFAAQGQSFFQASGDSGAYAAAIDEPSDDPYLTIVGGTTLTTGSSGAWSSETVWLTPASKSGLLGDTPEEASGGGVSLTYGIPAWQQGISMSANQGSTTMRNLPDVALVANNVAVVWGKDYLGSSLELAEGGTSVATPLWAGFIALVNQQAAANGQPRVGFLNPALYAIGKSTNYLSCFHDITTGDNFTPNSPGKYSATAGYDLCTGWGTLIGSNLINALLAPPSETLVITSPAGFTSIGPGGGPFSVASQTYTLTNIGSMPLNWSLASTSSWLTVSAGAGTLNPGGAGTTVTVSLNAAATNFLIAHYSGNVTFSNLSDGTFQNRQFDLYAGNGGFETGDFTDWNLIGDTNLDFTLSADDVDVAGTNALAGEPDVLFVHSGLYGAFLSEHPSNGSLSQTVATMPGRQYMVSFWLACVPRQGATASNDFTAKWNGSTLYTQTNLNAFAWTNLQFGVSATSSSTTLEFDFNDSSGAFGLDDVTVESAPAPVFQTFIATNGVIALSWSAVANLSYQIQSATNLYNPNWTNLAGPITATGVLASASEPVGTAPVRFYRVVLLPP